MASNQLDLLMKAHELSDKAYVYTNDDTDESPNKPKDPSELSIENASDDSNPFEHENSPEILAASLNGYKAQESSLGHTSIDSKNER